MINGTMVFFHQPQNRSATPTKIFCSTFKAKLRIRTLGSVVPKFFGIFFGLPRASIIHRLLWWVNKYTHITLLSAYIPLCPKNLSQIDGVVDRYFGVNQVRELLDKIIYIYIPYSYGTPLQYPITTPQNARVHLYFSALSISSILIVYIYIYINIYIYIHINIYIYIPWMFNRPHVQKTNQSDHLGYGERYLSGMSNGDPPFAMVQLAAKAAPLGFPSVSYCPAPGREDFADDESKWSEVPRT